MGVGAEVAVGGGKGVEGAGEMGVGTIVGAGAAVAVGTGTGVGGVFVN